MNIGFRLEAVGLRKNRKETVLFPTAYSLKPTASSLKPPA
jgi:hypothetical protein